MELRRFASSLVSRVGLFGASRWLGGPLDSNPRGALLRRSRGFERIGCDGF
jgi:hypothetical protein